MSFFKKLVGKNKGGAFLGGTLGSLAGGASMGMLGAAAGSKAKGSSLSDMLLGKKQKDIMPDEIAGQIRDTQSRGITELNTALDSQGADQMINQQVEAQKKGVLSAAQDARRNAQRSMARSGLQGSSIGLNLNRSIDQQAGKDINSINASQPGLLRNQKIMDATTRIGVGGINQGGINFNQIQGQREGGILGLMSAVAPLAGSAAGAYKDYQTGQLYKRS